MEPTVLTAQQALLLRLRAQGLWSRPHTSVAEVVAGVCAVQAQEEAAAALAIRVRSSGLSAADVERAGRSGALVRSWCLRGTLHLVVAEDLPWMVDLVGPSAIAASSARRRQLGLDDGQLTHGGQVLRQLLAGGRSASRDEVSEHLMQEGIRLEGQALYHLLRHQALAGVVCLVAGGGEPRYLLVGAGSQRSPGSPEAAAGELARRYLAGYGPAGLEDFERWSGLRKNDARRGWRQIADETIEIRSGDRIGRMPAERASWLTEAAPAGHGRVRLLPGYDSYLLGYRGRDLVVAPEHARQLHPGGGLLRPALLVDGRVEGTWTIRRRRSGVEVVVRPFARLAADTLTDLEAEVADLGRFLAAEVALRLGTDS